jgi:hypothetical protein
LALFQPFLSLFEPKWRKNEAKMMPLLPLWFLAALPANPGRGRPNIDYLPRRVEVDFHLGRLPGASSQLPISGAKKDLHLCKKLDTSEANTSS